MPQKQNKKMDYISNTAVLLYAMYFHSFAKNIFLRARRVYAREKSVFKKNGGNARAAATANASANRVCCDHTGTRVCDV